MSRDWWVSVKYMCGELKSGSILDTMLYGKMNWDWEGLHANVVLAAWSWIYHITLLKSVKYFNF